MDLPSTHASLFSPADGDEDSGPRRWEAVHARYRDVVLGWCRRRELPHADAEDLAQEVWIKLLRDLNTYDPAKGRFRSWLKAVVNNALTDFWRRQGQRPERGGVGGSLFLQRLANLADPEAVEELSSVIERQAGAIASEVLARVRERLQETTWQAFYQTLIEKRPARDVALDLGLSVSSVYKNAYRVKQMLHEEYAHVHPTGGAVLSEPGNPEPVSA